jgi:hypothetical protein
MGKPNRRSRLAHRANAKTSAGAPEVADTKRPVEPTQQTKDEKRQAKHDAFLKSM